MCTMGPGDLVINPSWAWHDHGNNGKEEVTYLNILDVPLVAGLGCTFYDHDYHKEGDTSKTIQSIRKPRNRSETLYSAGGIMPKVVPNTGKPYSPQLVYKYDTVRAALERLQALEPDPYDGYLIEYVNPETGGPVMPTMSFTMQLLKSGQKNRRFVTPRARSIAWLKARATPRSMTCGWSGTRTTSLWCRPGHGIRTPIPTRNSQPCCSASPTRRPCKS